MFITDIYEIAAGAQEEIGINMHLDIIFSEELQQYFNYSYDYAEDIIVLNFELEFGSAKLSIINAQSPDYSYVMNSDLKEYLNKINKSAC